MKVLKNQNQTTKQPWKSNADLSLLTFRKRSWRHCEPFGRCLCNVVI